MSYVAAEWFHLLLTVGTLVWTVLLKWKKTIHYKHLAAIEAR